MNSFLDQFDFSSIRHIDLVTTFKPRDPEQLTKPFQIKDFFNYFKIRYPDVKVAVHVDNDLHGKLYISKFSDKKMLLTSANFTQSGMSENHEWGIVVEDSNVIETTLEEVFESIDYPEITINQINRACQFAEGNKKENPKWAQKIPITCDILGAVYSVENQDNKDPKYFLKPWGTVEDPVSIESQRDFSELHQNLHFSVKKPKGVRKGDFIITTAIGVGGEGALLSYFRVTGGIQLVTDEQTKQNPRLERWPWFMEGRNHSPSFGKNWWKYVLRRQDLLEEFKEKYPNIPITYAGGFTLGTINRGNDKVRITKEFGDFLISKMNEYDRIMPND